MPNEPVLTAVGIYAFVNAILAFARIMGWLDFSDEQLEALMNVVEIVAPVVVSVAGGLWARSKVTPVNKPQAINTDGELVALSPTDGSTLPGQV